jgi:periplasmic divalent cation tolerance protein
MLLQWSAMAAAARRTPANVKSSAMMPRQPEVPKWIALLAMRRYCILARKERWQNFCVFRCGNGGARPRLEMTDKIIVLVTCGSMKEAKGLAGALVEARLVACANIFSAPMESVYRWKGRIERAKEFLLLVKSTRKRFPALRREIERLHSYDMPEIIALPIVDGATGYLRWLGESVQPKRNRR